MGSKRFRYETNRKKRWKRQMVMAVMGTAAAAMAFCLGNAIDTFDRVANQTHDWQQKAEVEATLDALDNRPASIGLLVNMLQRYPFPLGWNGNGYSDDPYPSLASPISQLSIVPH